MFIDVGACAGVAGRLSHIQQCQAKAGSVQDVLELLTGRRNSSAGAGPGSGDNVALAALNGCLGNVKALTQAMEACRKGIFQAWQVCDCCTALRRSSLPRNCAFHGTGCSCTGGYVSGMTSPSAQVSFAMVYMHASCSST